METRANYVIIGLFTLLVVIGAFGAVFWLVRSEGGGDRDLYDIVFRGSVTGLAQGGAVHFNGLRVGDVAQLGFDPADPTQVVARISVRPDTPVRLDTRVRLEYQGLTGVAFIQMKSGERTSPPLETSETDVPRIVAEGSAVEDLIEGARDVLSIANTTLRRLEEVVDANEESVTRTVGNLETFSSALASNSEHIDTFLENVGEAAQEIGQVADTLDTILGDNAGELQSTLQNIATVTRTLAESDESIRATIQNAERFSETLAGSSQAIDGFVADASSASERINTVAGSLETLITANQASIQNTITNVETVTNALANNADGIDQFLGDARALSARFNEIAAQIDGVIAENRTNFRDTLANTRVLTGSLADNADDISSMVSNVSEVARRLNTVAGRIDQLTERVDALVNGEGESFFVDAAAAAKSVRRAAEEVEAQIGPAVAGLSRLSSRSVGDLEAFLDESRNAVSRLDRVLSDIESNPSQFFFSGRNVPEYGRGRR